MIFEAHTNGVTYAKYIHVQYYVRVVPQGPLIFTPIRTVTDMICTHVQWDFCKSCEIIITYFSKCYYNSNPNSIQSCCDFCLSPSLTMSGLWGPLFKHSIVRRDLGK